MMIEGREENGGQLRIWGRAHLALYFRLRFGVGRIVLIQESVSRPSRATYATPPPACAFLTLLECALAENAL